MTEGLGVGALSLPPIVTPRHGSACHRRRKGAKVSTGGLHDFTPSEYGDPAVPEH